MLSSNRKKNPQIKKKKFEELDMRLILTFRGSENFFLQFFLQIFQYKKNKGISLVAMSLSFH